MHDASTDHPGGARRPSLQILRGRLAGGAARQLAGSSALLDRVARPGGSPTARLYRPQPTVAFGRIDVLRPGIGAAAAAARAHGFAPVLRAPGGRAAAYHAGSLVLEMAVPEPDPRATITTRFRTMAGVLVVALGRLGVAADVGELPAEYCPGRYSLLAGGVKLGGIAQRVVRGASLTGVAIVVEDGAAIREVLRDVSAALGYAFDPRTAGAASELVPGLTVDRIASQIERSLGAAWELVSLAADEPLLRAARDREPEHLVAEDPGARAAGR